MRWAKERERRRVAILIGTGGENVACKLCCSRMYVYMNSPLWADGCFSACVGTQVKSTWQLAGSATNTGFWSAILCKHKPPPRIFFFSSRTFGSNLFGVWIREMRHSLQDLLPFRRCLGLGLFQDSPAPLTRRPALPTTRAAKAACVWDLGNTQF